MLCQQTVGWQKAWDNLICDEIEVLLASISDEADFYNVIREALERVGHERFTGTVSYRAWYLLPSVVCDAISGHYEYAIPASASLKLFMAAGEVFDDIEDTDVPGSLPARYGTAIATNAATILLILAERALTRLKRNNVADNVIVRIMDSVNSFYSTACVGQHLDLSLTSKTAISEDTYLKIAYMKSATTIECACQIGAMLATVNQELIDSFTSFGRNLGITSQIANDIQGITSGRDIVGQKITLPVIYTLAYKKGEDYNRLKFAFSKRCESISDPTQIKDLLFNCGAIHYSILKMETYKQHSLDILYELRKTGANIERLRLFLE